MSEIKDVKCEKCRQICGRRKDNWFAERSLWQFHRRSFIFTCQHCAFVNTFRVNQASKKRFADCLAVA